MRLVHGSMTDPAGARAGDLAAAQGRLAATALPDPAHPLRAPLPWLPLARGARLNNLATHLATSQSAQALQMGAALPALAFDPVAAREAFDLAVAVARQWWSLQAQWVDGLAELAQEMGEVRQANTVSKFVDQEVNLVQQGMALVSSQATATVRLMENIQVNLAWWVGQRGRPPA